MNKQELNYIAGFLDGDGCVMLQLVFHKDYRLGYEIRPSIVFYQKSNNKDFLIWLRERLKVGYIRDRNDGMSEYDIVGMNSVPKILVQLSPFLRLKKEQARLALLIFKQMPESGRQMEAVTLLRLAKEVDKFASLNYSKKRTNTSKQVEEFLKSQHLLSP